MTFSDLTITFLALAAAGAFFSAVANEVLKADGIGEVGRDALKAVSAAGKIYAAGGAFVAAAHELDWSVGLKVGGIALVVFVLLLFGAGCFYRHKAKAAAETALAKAAADEAARAEAADGEAARAKTADEEAARAKAAADAAAQAAHVKAAGDEAARIEAANEAARVKAHRDLARRKFGSRASRNAGTASVHVRRPTASRAHPRA